jgi:hypothetical protein
LQEAFLILGNEKMASFRQQEIDARLSGFYACAQAKLGKVAASISSYKSALWMHEQLNLVTSHFYSLCLMDLARSYFKTGAFDLAWECACKGFSVAESLGTNFKFNFIAANNLKEKIRAQLQLQEKQRLREESEQQLNQQPTPEIPQTKHRSRILRPKRESSMSTDSILEKPPPLPPKPISRRSSLTSFNTRPDITVEPRPVVSKDHTPSMGPLNASPHLNNNFDATSLPLLMETATLIGRGSLCEVHKTVWTGAVVALKTLLNPTMTDSLSDEISLLLRLRHPHVIQVLSAVGPNAFVMELASGSLTQLIRAVQRCGQIIPAACIRDFAQQIVAGMLYLHSNGILHRDLVIFFFFLKFVDLIPFSRNHQTS